MLATDLRRTDCAFLDDAAATEPLFPVSDFTSTPASASFSKAPRARLMVFAFTY